MNGPVSRRTAVVVFSGGQDSTTCLYVAKQQFERVVALTFNYGQRHAREIAAAAHISAAAGVEWECIDVPAVLRSSSPLVDRAAELETYTDYESMDAVIGDRVELTFVPMRNAFFLTLAANFAISVGSRDLFTGVCQMDNANYPDCRERFIRSQQHTINDALGLAPYSVEAFAIHAPLLHLSKAQSIALAQAMPGCMEALAFSHTCYSGTFPPCGQCHSCVLRAEGFRLAGVADPLVERAATFNAQQV